MTGRVAPMTAVLLRCDATTGGGLGHLARCVALAQALRTHGVHDIHLSGAVTTELGERMLEPAGLQRHGPIDDPEQLIALAEDVGAGVLHIDHYGPFPGLREAGRARGIVTSTAVDDDFGKRPADVIVDGSPRALVRFDPLYATSSVALGPKNLVMREGLGSARTLREVRPRPHVLVMMGGTDAGGHGPRIASSMAAIPAVGRVGLVADGVAAASPDFQVVARNPDLRSLLEDWDVVVTGAGTTVWELAALQVPMVVVGLVENQRDHYGTLVGSGLAVGLGFLPDGSPLAIHEVAAAMADPLSLTRMAERARGLVDGRGARRVVRTWSEERISRSRVGLRVRPASERDVGRLYAWRNDPATRAASRSQEPVGWSDHVVWFAGAREATDRRVLVVESDGEPIATTRFDRRGADEWEFSITLAPEARGRGWAKAVVAESVAEFRSRSSSTALLLADVRTSNDASNAVFQSLGWRPGTPGAGWMRWSLSGSEVREDPT